jgi:hypothetical protein
MRRERSKKNECRCGGKRLMSALEKKVCRTGRSTRRGKTERGR